MEHSSLRCCSHRHSRYALFFHSLAMISCIRKGEITPQQYARYSHQIDENQTYIRKFVYMFYALSNPLTDEWQVVVAEPREQQHLGCFGGRRDGVAGEQSRRIQTV